MRLNAPVVAFASAAAVRPAFDLSRELRREALRQFAAALSLCQRQQRAYSWHGCYSFFEGRL